MAEAQKAANQHAVQDGCFEAVGNAGDLAGLMASATRRERIARLDRLQR